MLFNRGPDGTHECFESFESFFPKKDIEFIYYDQLGCGNSDNPEYYLFLNLPILLKKLNKFVKHYILIKTIFICFDILMA